MRHIRRAALSAIVVFAASYGSTVRAYAPFDDRSQFIEASAGSIPIDPNSSSYNRIPYWDPASSRWLEAGASQFLCGYGLITGDFESGAWKTIALHAPDGGPWFTMVSSGDDQPELEAGVRCVPYTHFAGFRPELLTVRDVFTGVNGAELLGETRFVTTFNGFAGALDGGGEKIHFGPKADGNFYLRFQAAGLAAVTSAWAFGKAYYWGEPPNGGSYRAGRAFWHQGDPAVKLIAIRDGFCLLAGLSGRFRGFGERVLIYPGEDGYWYLLGTSQQRDVGAIAECFWYDPR